MFKRTIAATLIFGAAALAPPTHAQGANCMPRERLVESLSAKYSESLAGGGLQNERHLIEVWRSADSGSFTILMTRPDGISCVVAAGQNWHDAKLLPAGVTG